MGGLPRHDDDVAEALRRVLSSSGFRRNERMSRFLRLLVERHLEGRDEELKESVIAVDVFGRRPDYDPKLDSIVRTEAGRLRARLAEYYAGEGRADPLVIELPKGGYVPSLRERAVSDERVTTRPPQRWLRATVAGGLFALAAIGWRSAGPVETPPIRIAVLPLENRSADGSGGEFADGLTDEIIRNLSVIEGRAVCSHTSSFAWKD